MVSLQNFSVFRSTSCAPFSGKNIVKLNWDILRSPRMHFSVLKAMRRWVEFTMTRNGYTFLVILAVLWVAKTILVAWGSKYWDFMASTMKNISIPQVFETSLRVYILRLLFKDIYYKACEWESYKAQSVQVYQYCGKRALKPFQIIRISRVYSFDNASSTHHDITHWFVEYLKTRWARP